MEHGTGLSVFIWGLGFLKELERSFFSIKILLCGNGDVNGDFEFLLSVFERCVTEGEILLGEKLFSLDSWEIFMMVLEFFL